MKMIKNNRKVGDCGVVAAYNVLSWCNNHRSYREVEKVAKSCGYNSDKGIYFFQFANLIKKLNLPAKKIKPKSLEEILNKLYSGKFFVFLYTPTGSGRGHAMSAFVNHNGKIMLINPESKRSTWGRFCVDLIENGTRNFAIYEIPRRTAVNKNDESRSN